MSSAIVKNSLTGLKSFLQDYQASFTSGLLILFTACGEQIFKETTFQCPCKHSDAKSYVCAFVFAPAGVLFLLGIVVSNLTWRLFHGCVNRGGQEAKINRLNGCWNTTLHFGKVLAKSFVVPLAWLFIVALDGNYYACAMAEEPCNKTKKPCNETMAEPCNEAKGYNDYKTDSQFWGWILLFALVSIAVVVICLVRCFDSVTYEQNKFILSYRDEEQQQLDAAIKKCTEELAEKNVQDFMKENRSKEDWDFISKTPDSKVMKKVEPITIVLTPLNDLVNEHSVQPAQQGTNISVQPAQQGTNISVQPAQQGTNDSAHPAKQGTNNSTE